MRYETFSRGNIDITYRKSMNSFTLKVKMYLYHILEYDTSTEEETE